MQNQITFRQYRAIDLSIMGAVLAATQALISFAASRLFPDQLYVVSPAAAVVALVLMRWGVWAGIHAVLAGVVLCLASGGGVQHFVIYCIGNLLSLSALSMVRIFGKEKIRADSFLTEVFALYVQLAMLLGRAAMALLLQLPAGAATAFITTDALSIPFTMVILWAARRVDGLFEDQKHYLLRTQGGPHV